MRMTRMILLAALLIAVLVGGMRWLGTPSAQAAPAQATEMLAALPIVDDFQDPAVADTMFSYGDSGTSVNKSVVTTDTVPGSAGDNNVLRVEYVSAGWGAGTGRDIPGEDWSASDGVRFWFQGDGSGVMYRLILSDNGDPNASGDTSERFAYEWNDTVAGWRFMEIPWTLFFRDPGFQPGGAPNDGLTLTAVRAYAFALPSGNSKTIFVDDIKLFNYTALDSFPDQAAADSLFTYGDGGTSVNRSVVVTDSVPGMPADNTALQIDYVSAGWGAGVGRDIPGDDWSASDGISFWFNGDGSGVLYRLILSDNGDPNASGDTSERFAYEWNDTASGWHLISIPWPLFFRDPGFQPDGAPNDGLTLTAVKAYAFALPSGNSKTIFVDSVRLFGDGGGTQPPPPPASTLPIVTDFETGIPGTLGVFNDGGSSVQLALDTQSPPQVPTSMTNTTAIVTYTIVGGGFGGITDPFIETQDWTGYEAFGFWLKGSNSGVNHRIELKSQGGDAGASNLWQYSFADNFTGWKHFVVPFGDFVKRTDYNPGAGLGDSIDLSVMWGWSLLLDPNASGTLWLDDVRLFKSLYGENFESGIPAGLGVFNDGASSVVLVAETQSVPDKVPGGASSGIAAYTYTIADGGFGGITFPFAASQDWSGAQSFGFWIKGSNSGVNHRIELKSQGDDAGGANLWQYAFADDFTGWKYFQVPLSDFTKRTDYNPGAGLGDSIDPAVMWGWSILLDPNSTGTIWMDDVAVLGKPADVLKVAFAQAAYTVDEGDEATIDVALNMAATQNVTVTFSTADGTANAGSDYTTTTGSLIFAPGDTVKSFTVATVDDTDDESAETVNLSLSGADGAELGSRSSALLTIKDNDQAPPPVGGGHSVIVDSYAYTSGLPTGKDANDIGVGFVTWNAPGASASVTLTVPSEQVPGKPASNQVMQLDLNLGAGQWGGFTYAFPNEALDTWISQDWSAYEGVSFWLYGNNTGSIIFVDLQDNRNPGSTQDDAERWSTDIQDDFTGWQYFEISFSQFNRKDIGNGAPFDGFGKTEMHGYAFGGFNTIANQSYYIDDFGLIPRTTVVDDYELTSLPTGLDADNIGIGFVTWNAPGASAGITLTVPETQVPGKAAGNQVMQLDLNLGAGQWGGFTHAFENEALDTWISQDWSTYEGICFWLYGNDTGSVIFVDLQDNRNPGSTTDDAERWSKDIQDDFTGWKFFQIPFSEFNRKDIGNGAPFDGFGKTEMHGYAFGGFNTIANQSYFIDDFTLYGNVGGGDDGEATLAFSKAKYDVAEGETAVLTVSLSAASTTTVTVTYKSMESQATPDRDYTPVSGTLTFIPGEQAMTLSLPTLDDAKPESEEKLMINLYDVEGAEFGFQRRATLTIQDNDPANPADLNDVEGHHPFAGMGEVSLSVTELNANDSNAVPGQGAYEQVLTVQYDDAAATTNRIINSFTTPQDWSGADGLRFWYFGNNTGKTINVELWDNQIANTNSLTSTDWVMRWADEFNEPAGTPPNPNNWRHEIGDGSLNDNPGWGNSEFEFYTDDPANASTDGNGNLVIRLKKVDTENSDLLCYYGPCRYTSARLITADRAEFQYGRIEARIKLPPTDESGVWPAFWALGTDIFDPAVGWPQSGEIDVMEYVSRVPDEVFGTLHGPGYSGGASYGNTLHVPNLLADYHTYTIDWWENHIIWYVDGVKYHEAFNTDPFLSGKEWVYNHPFFLLLNVAIGGNFGGTVSDQITFPQDTLVDYVRVYQAPLSAELFEAGFVDNFTGWGQVLIPFSDFTRSTEQPADAPDDGLTLTSVHGYGFRFPSSPGSVNARATITTHIDQVGLVFNWTWIFPLFN